MLLSELSRQMRSKWEKKSYKNEPAKIWVWNTFKNDALNNILKPLLPLPPPGAFFMGVLTLWMNLKISFLGIWISSSICIFGEKVSNKSCSAPGQKIFNIRQNYKILIFKNDVNSCFFVKVFLSECRCLKIIFKIFWKFNFTGRKS